MTQSEMGQAKLELETLVDKHGLDQTIELLSEVCHEKAEHIVTNWQDVESASVWESRGRQLADLL
jgi:hypothetical protein